ncbi:hypothetical protein X801_02061, partial [Opisthorchis viverrini]
MPYVYHFPISILCVSSDDTRQNANSAGKLAPPYSAVAGPNPACRSRRATTVGQLPTSAVIAQTHSLL